MTLHFHLMPYKNYISDRQRHSGEQSANEEQYIGTTAQKVSLGPRRCCTRTRYTGTRRLPTKRYCFVQCREIDRCRCIGCGQVGVESGRNKDRSASRTDSRRVRCDEGDVHIWIEWTGYCAACIGEGNGRAGDVDVLVARCRCDERIDVGHCPAGKSQRDFGV